jgi:hypothetical protein
MELTSPESSELLHPLLCIYILGQRPAKLKIKKQLKQFNVRDTGISPWNFGL